MKRKMFFNVMITGILASALLSGCGKKETTPENNFVYNDTTYKLSQGLISTSGMEDGFYYHAIFILSDGFKVVWETDNPQMVDSLAGRGELIGFFLIDKSEDGPEDGTYNAIVISSKSLTLPTPFTWARGMAYIDYTEIGDETLGQKINLTKGTIKVKNNGNNNLELTINVTSDKNVSLNGFFKGTFKSFILDDKKSLDVKTPFRRM